MDGGVSTINSMAGDEVTSSNEPRRRAPSLIHSEGNPFASGDSGASLKIEILTDAILIKNDELDELVGTLAAIEENEKILQMLELKKTPYLFNSAGLLKILSVTTSVKTRLAIVASIGPRLTDPKAKTAELVGLFRYSEEKQKVEEILKARASTLSASAFTRGGLALGRRASTRPMSTGGRGRGRPESGRIITSVSEDTEQIDGNSASVSTSNSVTRPLAAADESISSPPSATLSTCPEVVCVDPSKGAVDTAGAAGGTGGEGGGNDDDDDDSSDNSGGGERVCDDDADGDDWGLQLGGDEGGNACPHSKDPGPPRPPDMPPAVCGGHMNKLSDHLKTWRRRFFRLVGGKLEIFVESKFGEQVLKETFSLTSQQRVLMDTKHPFRFGIGPAVGAQAPPAGAGAGATSASPKKKVALGLGLGLGSLGGLGKGMGMGMAMKGGSHEEIWRMKFEVLDTHENMRWRMSFEEHIAFATWLAQADERAQEMGGK